MNIKFVFVCVCFVVSDDFVRCEIKNAKIMSGSIAAPRQFPFMVSIQIRRTGQPFCGGAIIDSRHVLTAAHCMYLSIQKKTLLQASQLQIRAGTTNLLEGGKIALVRKIFIHSQYENRILDNDIAILQIAGRGFLFSSVIRPVDLSTGFINSSTLNHTCTIIGWGRQCGSIIKKTALEQRALNTDEAGSEEDVDVQSVTNLPNIPKSELNFSSRNLKTINITTNSTSVTNSTSDTNSTVEIFATSSTEVECHETFAGMLRYAEIPIQNTSECAKDYFAADITDNVICAGTRKSRIDSCKGDSGGPLVCKGKVEGIVSFGDGCDNWNHLGVYTRVYNHLKWINNTINSSSSNFKINNTFQIVSFINLCFVIIFLM